MQGAWRIGRLFGVDTFVHWTFLIIPALAYAASMQSGGGAVWGVVAVLYVLTIFACVLFHELGHALMARRFGIATRDITLLPIGGIARLERMPEAPAQELLIAVAGPLVNVAIAGVIFAGLTLAGEELVPVDVAPSVGVFFTSVFWTNLVLAGFNCLPAFPLDGGRVLRALLAFRLDYLRATRIAAAVGQVLGVALGIIALLSQQFVLVVISVFIVFAARAELRAIRLRHAFRGVRVRQGMVTEVRTLAANASLEDAARALLAGAQQDFPVLDGGRLVGLLTRPLVVRGLATLGAGAPVSSVAVRVPLPLDPDDDLEQVLARLQEGPAIPVVEHGRLVGLLTADNLLELQMIRQARSESEHGVAGEPATV